MGVLYLKASITSPSAPEHHKGGIGSFRSHGEPIVANIVGPGRGDPPVVGVAVVALCQTEVADDEGQTFPAVVHHAFEVANEGEVEFDGSMIERGFMGGKLAVPPAGCLVGPVTADDEDELVVAEGPHAADLIVAFGVLSGRDVHVGDGEGFEDHAPRRAHAEIPDDFVPAVEKLSLLYR